MAPLPVITNVFRVAFNWQGPRGTTATNVMHFECPAGFPLSLVAEGLDDAATVAMWDWVAATCSVVDIAITPLDGLSPTEHFTPPTPANWIGGGLGEALPSTAGLIKLVTGTRGRSHRGRVFIPFVGEGEVSTGLMTDVAAVQAAWVAFSAALASDTPAIILGVASYKLATFSAITSLVAEGEAATQRRRQSRLR